MVREEVELRPLEPDEPKRSLLGALVRTARPRQWTKKVLVFAAPGAAGVLTEGTPLVRTLIAFVAFCLAASGTYFLNDAADAEADRLHPSKRERPVGAGGLSVGMARGVAVGFIVAALLVSAPVNDGKLTAVVAAYLAVTITYSFWLKHEAVIDLAAVA